MGMATMRTKHTMGVVQLAALQVAIRQHSVREVEAAEVAAGERQPRHVQAPAVVVARGQQRPRETFAALEHGVVHPVEVEPAAA